MSDRLTPTMRQALRHLYSGRRLLWRPPDVPGGAPTVRALVKRELLEQSGGYLALTDRGAQAARELGGAA
jgi:predicted phage gp36 major capsid-like protein